jgi:serine/threonine protein kinase
MVFVARDTGLDRDCAVKFLLPEHTARPEILQRFLKEARSAAKIDHGGIVTVFECGVVEGAGPALDGMAYIAMELLKGESLSDRMKQRGLAVDLAVEIARQVAAALAAAHAVGSRSCGWRCASI